MASAGRKTDFILRILSEGRGHIDSSLISALQGVQEIITENDGRVRSQDIPEEIDKVSAMLVDLHVPFDTVKKYVQTGFPAFDGRPDKDDIIYRLRIYEEAKFAHKKGGFILPDGSTTMDVFGAVIRVASDMVKETDPERLQLEPINRS